MIEKIIEDADKSLDKLKKYDKIIYEKVLDIINENIVDGKIFLSEQVMAGLEDLLIDELEKFGIFKDIVSYLKIYNTLDFELIEEQGKINKLKANELKEFWKKNKSRQILTNKLKYDLSKNGMAKTYVNAVASLVREQAFLQVPFKEAQKLLKEKLIDNNVTTRYIKTTVRDVASQYDGAFQNEIRKKYDFKNFIIIGDLIEDSRPVCRHLVDLRRLTYEQMEKVLDEYCPNGKPSEKIVELNGKKIKKGSGMIEKTTIDNIETLRGGYGCRHRIISTK